MFQAFLFDGQAVKIPNSHDPFEYELFQSNSATPTHLDKLPNPTMSVFKVPKYKSAAKNKGPRVAKPKAEKATARAKATTTSSTPKQSGGLEVEALDDAIANLKSSMAKAEAEKRENSYALTSPHADMMYKTDLNSRSVIVDNLPSKGAKGKTSKTRLLGAPVPAAPRSIPPSPALSGLGSPSLGSTSTNATQERVKQQRFPIIHELAVQELSFEDLLAKYGDGNGTDQDFNSALNKVADFDNDLQKWVLKKMYWKELDVFQYDYADEADRQKAIDNAIKQYDRMRLGSSDPLWQKLLPIGDRGKDICLSKLQAAIAKGPAAPTPKNNGHKTDGASPSGGDSGRDDSGSAGAKKGKGGEPMSRSSSQASIKKKISASEAQAKRLLANSKKPSTTTVAKASPKPSPKVSPTKPTAKAPAVKGGARVLSKEFVTDSDSDNDEVPLSTSLPKTKSAPTPAPPKVTPAEKSKVAEKPKPAEKARIAERPKVADKPKAKVTPTARPNPKNSEHEKERDTIRAQVIAKPARLPAKRPRDIEDDDSSSSGTPLSKRIKPPVKAQVSAVNSIKKRAPSDASQNSRGTSSGVSLNKSKNTSPIKSSPLASSPPTNASDADDDRNVLSRAREREREREHDRETIISSASSSSGSTSSVGIGRKRPAESYSDSKVAKRQRVSPEVMLKAHKFKQFYVRYHQLHEEISQHDNPSPDRVADLVDMRDRLSEMKREIYSEVTVE